MDFTPPTALHSANTVTLHTHTDVRDVASFNGYVARHFQHFHIHVCVSVCVLAELQAPPGRNTGK